VVEYAKTLPNVVYAEDNAYTCSPDARNEMIEKIKKHKINRVIVGSGTPRTFEPLFQETIREAGLNPHLIEIANIRDQCSQVHMKEPEKANQKAKALVRIAVAKAGLLEPLPTNSSDIIQKGLVIGGGLAGMISALTIADQGYDIYLIEKEDVLGGNLRNIHYTLENEDIQGYMRNIINKVENNPHIKVFKNSRVEKIEGYVGKYNTTINDGSKQTKLKNGVIIVATGAEEIKPKEYLYGKDARVMTQLELEKQIATDGDFSKKTIVMIQCVGSRDEEHCYCSRICCTSAIKNALKLKEKHPDAIIYILYRDMRTYGFRESFYEKARDKGIIFIRYAPEEKPIVQKNKEELTLLVKEPILDEKLLIHADFVVLSPAIVPRGDSIELATQLKVPLTKEGFYQEAHTKFRPVDFSTKGIYLCGLAHSPRFIEESIVQAKAASARAITILSKEQMETKENIARVSSRNCAGCKLCIEVCPYDALTFDEEKKIAVVNEILCQGCGTCTVICSSGVSQQNKFTKRQILSMVDACLE
jgi:heterodisulfide reductase subunit A